MVNYYKLIALFLIVWRIVDFGFVFIFDGGYFSVASYEKTFNIKHGLIWESRINKAKQELLHLEEKIKNINFIVQNLK